MCQQHVLLLYVRLLLNFIIYKLSFASLVRRKTLISLRDLFSPDVPSLTRLPEICDEWRRDLTWCDLDLFTRDFATFSTRCCNNTKRFCVMTNDLSVTGGCWPRRRQDRTRATTVFYLRRWLRNCGCGYIEFDLKSALAMSCTFLQQLAAFRTSHWHVT